jgi:hypothetical protein
MAIALEKPLLQPSIAVATTGIPTAEIIGRQIHSGRLVTTPTWAFADDKLANLSSTIG